VLTKAKGLAVEKRCMSRMRQFNVLIEFYRSDYDGWYPENVFWGLGSEKYGHGSFVDKILPYVPDDVNNTGWANTSDTNVIICPRADYRVTTQDANYIRQSLYISWGWKLSSYVITGLFGYGDIANVDPTFYPQKNLGNREPDMLALMGEIKTASHQLGYLNYTWMVAYNHMPKTNILFADGHIRSFTIPIDAHRPDEFIFY
jgi:prepilin-type processing-associated H-X9-DG protein